MSARLNGRSVSPKVKEIKMKNNDELRKSSAQLASNDDNKSVKFDDNYLCDQSLATIKEKENINFDPHNYQSYYNNIQIVGTHHFKNEHNNNIYFNKNCIDTNRSGAYSYFDNISQFNLKDSHLKDTVIIKEIPL